MAVEFSVSMETFGALSFQFGGLQTCKIRLEIAFDIDDSFFVRSLARFTDRRVEPAEMCSDNGANYVECLRFERSRIAPQPEEKWSMPVGNRNPMAQ